MSATTYVVPDNPADPEAAALELIVRMPQTILNCDDFTPVLQELCSIFDAEGAFAGLSWGDAKQIAAAVSADLIVRNDAQEFIAQRARNVLGRRCGMTWDDREAAARALNIVAGVLGL